MFLQGLMETAVRSRRLSLMAMPASGPPPVELRLLLDDTIFV